MDKSDFSMCIKAVTPLHFGSGDTYKQGFDFIGKNIINVNGIMQHMKQKPQLLHEMAAAINGNRLQEFISRNKKEIPDACFRPMNVEEEPRGDIRAHIKNGLGQAYIPGSAIKGSIRTAIIKAMSSQDYLKKKVQGIMSAPRINVKFADSVITNSLLSPHPRGDAKFNLMKALRISDSDTINGGLQIKKIQIKNTSKGPLYVEVIPAGTITSFTLDLDDFFLSPGNRDKLFGAVKYDFNNLPADLNEATVKTLSYHYRFAKRNNLHAYDFLTDILKSLKGNEALVNLGYGIGWVGMTGNLLGSYYNTLGDREKLQLKSILRLNPTRHQQDYFPITRRFIKEGDREIPMGWALITFPENFRKKEWNFSGIPDCADYIDDIKTGSKNSSAAMASFSGGGLMIGQIYKAKIVAINDERKFAEAVVGKTKGRIMISEIANAYVTNMSDYIWEGKEVNVKVTEIRNGNYFFSIKKAQ
ncbi:MAG TPA: type III-A CRISPR-associated RAMP protein Csm5 [Spirochaetota bacterium]|nr:type III-A CRISPR-associated RAMP protein Csm5 [Spirochaetota bacterium]